MLGLGDFLAGSAFLLAIAGAAALSGTVLLRRIGPSLGGLDRALAWALCTTAALIAIHLVPLALGVLSRAGVLVTAALAAAAATAARRPRTAPVAVAAPAERGPLPRLALAAVALVGGCALMFLRDVAGEPVTQGDALSFQIPVVAGWMERGSLWGLDQFYPGYSNATYPQNGNVLLLAVILPFDSTFLVRFVAVPFAVLACAGIFALARELGASRTWALLAAAAFAAIPIVAKISLEGAQTDMPMLASFAIGGLFLARHHRTRARSDLLLAGIGLGIAFGTKWQAVSSVIAVLALWAAARALRREHLGRIGRDLVTVAGLLLLGGGIWLLRNVVETGNPVFPQALPGIDAPPDPVREAAGFSLAHYAFDGAVWRDVLWPQFRAFYALPGIGLAVAWVLALRRDAGRARLAAVAAVVLLAVYFVTPWSAFGPEGRPLLAFGNMRYGLPALVCAAVALAWGASKLPRWASAALGVAVAVAILDGLREQYALSAAKVLAGFVVVLALAWVARRRPAPAAVAAALLVFAFAGAAHVRARMEDRGYGRYEPAIGYIEQRAPSGNSVGLAGAWRPDTGIPPILGAFGPRLGNRVEFVGRFEDGFLRAYEDRAAFVREAREHDLLLIAREGGDREVGWARSAGFRELAGSARVVLMGRS